MGLAVTPSPARALVIVVARGSDGVNSGFQWSNECASVTCVGTACRDARVTDTELLAASGACDGDSGSPAIDAHGQVLAMAVRNSVDCSDTAHLQLPPNIQWLASNTAPVARADNRDVPQWALDAFVGIDAGADAGPSY